MKFYVAVTDYDWFQLHASKPHVDEVNFWRPSPRRHSELSVQVKRYFLSFTPRAISSSVADSSPVL